ncbi:MAG: preprotein translocase subunit SecG [Pseudomonadales bacterium]|jgi:preprotein translocase subunit SecG|nr:preprotein translocase subunit SecG [Pseudomonadales bacterium]
MEFFIIIVHVLAALGIVGLVLMQHGKGADMGAAFGSGASQTIFGSAGSGNVLTKSTTWLAVVFFATSLSLALIARQRADQGLESSPLIQNVDQLQNIIQQNSADIPAGDVPVIEAPASDVPAAPEIDAALDAASENTLETAPQETDNP